MRVIPGMEWHKKDLIRLARFLESEAQRPYPGGIPGGAGTRERLARYYDLHCAAKILRRVAKQPPSQGKS